MFLLIVSSLDLVVTRSHNIILLLYFLFFICIHFLYLKPLILEQINEAVENIKKTFSLGANPLTDVIRVKIYLRKYALIAFE